MKINSVPTQYQRSTDGYRSGVGQPVSQSDSTPPTGHMVLTVQLTGSTTLASISLCDTAETTRGTESGSLLEGRLGRRPLRSSLSLPTCVAAEAHSPPRAAVCELAFRSRTAYLSSQRMLVSCQRPCGAPAAVGPARPAGRRCPAAPPQTRPGAFAARTGRRGLANAAPRCVRASAAARAAAPACARRLYAPSRAPSCALRSADSL